MVLTLSHYLDWDGLVHLPSAVDPLGIIEAAIGRSQYGFQMECDEHGNRKVYSLSAGSEEEKKIWMHTARY